VVLKLRRKNAFRYGANMRDDALEKLAEEVLFGEKKKPSFAKQLYFGRFDAPLVFPYPAATPSEKEEVDRYVASVQQFADNKIDPVEIDRRSAIPQEVIATLGELGVLSMTIPQEYGGLGMSQYAYCRVMEMLASRCASTALFVNAHQSVGLKALLLYGTPEQKSRWLPKLCKGKALAAFSLTERNAGSDAAGIETEATYNPHSNTYTIQGRKQWTTNGSVADILTVMAKTDGKITAFLVTPDMPGFKVLDAALDKVGMRGSITSNLAFEGVEVPAENILGPKGGGLKVCLTVLDYGRTTFGATCTGAAKKLMHLAREHAISRIQFKKPLAAFALVKKKIADMHALVYAMESATYLTAGFIDRKVEDVMLESAILKVFNSDALWSILYDTMQIFGGRSIFTDAPLERMMRDARINMIGEGSNEVLRAFIGAVGLRDVGIQLKNLKERLGSSLFDAGTWKDLFSISSRYFTSPSVPVKSKQLKKAAHSLSRNVKDFGFAVFKVLYTYGEGVVDKQLDLNRLAEAAMALYTSTAVIGRLDQAIQSNTLAPNELACGLYYCEIASRKLQANLSELFDPLDRTLEKVSDSITER
jgi:alkylation response protein AidB-like acyl-CoA dehydrogenase